MPIWRHLTSSPRLNGLSQNWWIRQVQVTPEGTPALLDSRSTETQERSKFCKLQLLHCEARVAKLADARDLKSRDSKESYRFDSDPGHQISQADTPMSGAAGVDADGRLTPRFTPKWSGSYFQTQNGPTVEGEPDQLPMMGGVWFQTGLGTGASCCSCSACSARSRVSASRLRSSFARASAMSSVLTML
jgi:hypothetical protein